MTYRRDLEAMITAEFVRDVFSYDRDTGELRWRRRPNNRAYWCPVGEEAGFVRKDGYRQVKLFSRPFLAHRIIWLYETGSWPREEIDHKDGRRSRNVWSNLREATLGQNLQNKRLYKNNTSGHPGISRRENGTWRMQIAVDGQRRTKTFKTRAEALAARAAAKAVLHPFEPNQRA